MTVKIGDKVVITKGNFEDYIGEVVRTFGNGDISVELTGTSYDYYPHLFKGEYRPIETGESKPKSSEDLLANLARRVTSIERKLSEVSEQVDSNTRDIRTIGEEVAGLADVNERVEMLTDDIVTLDERTQCLTEQGIEQLAKDLVGLINERLQRL